MRSVIAMTDLKCGLQHRNRKHRGGSKKTRKSDERAIRQFSEFERKRAHDAFRLNNGPPTQRSERRLRGQAGKLHPLAKHKLSQPTTRQESRTHSQVAFAFGNFLREWPQCRYSMARKLILRTTASKWNLPAKLPLSSSLLSNSFRNDEKIRCEMRSVGYKSFISSKIIRMVGPGLENDSVDKSPLSEMHCFKHSSHAWNSAALIDVVGP